MILMRFAYCIKANVNMGLSHDDNAIKLRQCPEGNEKEQLS